MRTLAVCLLLLSGCSVCKRPASMKADHCIGFCLQCGRGCTHESMMERSHIPRAGKGDVDPTMVHSVNLHLERCWADLAETTHEHEDCRTTLTTCHEGLVVQTECCGKVQQYKAEAREVKESRIDCQRALATCLAECVPAK